MRQQAWNYKSEVAPKGQTSGNSKIEYFKMVDREDELFNTIFVLNRLAILWKSDNMIGPARDESFLENVIAFSIDLDMKVMARKDEESGLTVCYSIREYMPVATGQSIDFDSLPRLTEEEFYSL